MNQKATIKTNDGETIFSGNILDMPIKHDYIVQRSIEMFDDDDPCIIHKSFVIKKVIDELLDIIKPNNTVKLSDIKEKVDYINVENMDDCILIIGE